MLLTGDVTLLLVADASDGCAHFVLFFAFMTLLLIMISRFPSQSVQSS